MRTRIPLFAVKGAAHYAASKAAGNKVIDRAVSGTKELPLKLVLEAMDAARREALFHQYRHAIGSPL